LEENENYRIRPSTSNHSKFKLDEREFNESEIEKEDDDNENNKDQEKDEDKILKTVSELEKINELTNDNNIDASKFHDAIDNEDDLFVPVEQTDEWRTKSKHIFILSEAGKPIYSL
jgi:hypothetical protein